MAQSAPATAPTPRAFPAWLLLLLYAPLLIWAIQAIGVSQKVATATEAAGLNLGFEGMDWVQWEDQEGRVVARRVHPLLAGRSFPPEKVQAGDRLRKINYHEIYAAEAAQRIIRAAAPGRVMLYQVERISAQSGLLQIHNLRIVSGFRPAFTFAEHAWYWRLQPWIAGIGAILALMILLVLAPFLRRDWQGFALLFLQESTALLLFLSLLARHLWWVSGNELPLVLWPERVFVPLFSALLTAFGLLYLRQRTAIPFIWIIPGIGFGLALVLWAAACLWGALPYLPYRPTIEAGAALLFLSSLLTASAWSYWTKRSRVLHAFVALFSAAGIIALLAPAGAEETVLLGLSIALLFPLVHAAYYQLQFGKVSLVVTQSLQTAALLALVLALYALLREAGSWLIPQAPWRPAVEVLALAVLLMGFRGLYNSQAPRIRRYVITTRQEKDARMQAFIASIPQYASAAALEEALLNKLQDYTGGARCRIWWTQSPESALAEGEVSRGLIAAHAIWARSKELSSWQMRPELEEAWNASPYALALPLHVPAAREGLLLLGPKRRGVYNLGELEMLFRLIQQTQLTLNVLALLARERELIEQRYRANLMALRSQINPHFLFNTLNTISALVHDAPEQAEQAVERLAFIFRYTLRHSEDDFVRLQEELELVGAYLQIEQIRFGKRLTTQISYAPELADAQTPAFAIQTLVENSIKHGIAKIIGPGEVRITVRAGAQGVICEVLDNGIGVDMDRLRKGTGLNNVFSRLESLYGEKAGLQFERLEPGTRARLFWPG